MSFVLAAPAALVTAASDLAGNGSTLSTATAAAAAPTTGVLAAAADDVSTQIAAQFSEYGLGYQQLSAQVAAFHEQFVQTLTAGANTYATAEANVAQTLVNAVNAPAEAVLGHPLIGSGATSPASSMAASASAAAGGVVSNAMGRAANVVLGNSGAGLIGSAGSNLLGGNGAAAISSGASALLLRPTGGAMTAASALLAPAAMTNAAVAPAALASGSIGNAIKNLYLAVEPWVQYGFNLLSYAVGWVPWIGILAPPDQFLLLPR
jgi:PE family